MRRSGVSLITAMLATAADRVFAADTVVELHTEAAVLAADCDWLAAELRGDLRTWERLCRISRQAFVSGCFCLTIGGRL
jgi:hypothetical protein